MTEEAPARIGRFGVLGRLATGGMAEVLLGHLSGPSGFERPVVIKRILPHIASDPRFRDMFLDEARVASQIQHSNVVQYLELGDSDGLFLVIEYLAGESLSAVRRRAHARGVPIDPALAAYIVAEACAGLHAAHELVDADGAPQCVVHRDVSPDNLFVGYDGAVKVIDFGIATAANRLTATESGVIKGKFEYMSPEQARAEQLDRRSDLFSLGIVLHELLTGRRLFKRRNAAGTLRAILEETAPDPRLGRPDCPAALAAVCQMALARSAADRYPSALAMRRALHVAIADSAELPDQALRALLESLFADRIEQKREMLRRMRVGEPIEIPTADVDLEVELPEPMLEAPAADVGSRRFVARAVGAGAAAMAAVVAVAAIAWALGGPEREEAAWPGAAAEPGLSATVQLRVESEPAATLRLDGRERGVTPVTLEVARSSEAVAAELAAQGYETHRFTIEPAAHQRLRLVLTALPDRAEVEAQEPPVQSSDAPGSELREAEPPRRARPSSARRRPARAREPEPADWEDARF